MHLPTPILSLLILVLLLGHWTGGQSALSMDNTCIAANLIQISDELREAHTELAIGVNGKRKIKEEQFFNRI
jgi:hypothetical protein